MDHTRSVVRTVSLLLTLFVGGKFLDCQTLSLCNLRVYLYLLVVYCYEGFSSRATLLSDYPTGGLPVLHSSTDSVSELVRLSWSGHSFDSVSPGFVRIALILELCDRPTYECSRDISSTTLRVKCLVPCARLSLLHWLGSGVLSFLVSHLLLVQRD